MSNIPPLPPKIAIRPVLTSTRQTKLTRSISYRQVWTNWLTMNSLQIKSGSKLNSTRSWLSFEVLNKTSVKKFYLAIINPSKLSKKCWLNQGATTCTSISSSTVISTNALVFGHSRRRKKPEQSRNLSNRCVMVKKRGEGNAGKNS